MGASASTDTGTVPSTSESESESESEFESTITSGRPYDVFLSFRGDTRYGFTDYLYHDLIAANIRTCRDREKLRSGDKLGSKLYQAIEESKIAIIVFSKGYAESKWCLRELAKIADCYNKKKLQIIPVLYDVTHNDVQDYQTGCYKHAFAKHADCKEAELGQWMNGFAMFAGLDKLVAHNLPEETCGYQGELVKKIVKRVSSDLEIKDAHLPENLVGMGSHIRRLEHFLTSTYSNGVHVIMILGMSGIGKTTIAQVFYNKFNNQFDGHHCFLEDVGGRSQQDDGIMNLQKELISKINSGEKPNIGDIYKGAGQIKETIKAKKVFIVLDNVNSRSRIEMLMPGGRDALRQICEPGSLFVITTTNENILHENEVTFTYKPDYMGERDATRLFCLHAFKKDYPPNDFVSLTKEVVSSAGGLPLVLVILGSSLFVEDTTSWIATLKKLKAIPRMEVLERLRIGYDALDYEQKQIFLDIACFFSGTRIEYPFYMWDDCGFHPSEGIEALVRRSLIAVRDGDSIVTMNDQLIQLGKQIVKEKTDEPYVKVPLKRSRLWDQHESLEIVAKYQGIYKVEALNLNFTKVSQNQYDAQQLSLISEDYVKSTEFGPRFNEEQHFIRRLCEKDFSHLPNLRFLRLGYVSLDGDFKRLFSNLKWLEWKCCQKIISINFNPKNLIILDLSDSAITESWNHWTLIKAANKLKVLNLSGCKSMRSVPDFFVTLEILNLSRTQMELGQINPWVSKLSALRDLDISYCDIRSLDCSMLTNLVTLNASHCDDLETLGDFLNLRKLKWMSVSQCKQLVEIGSLVGLVSLEYLNMSSCHSIIRLPEMSNSQRLKILVLCYCIKLSEIEGLGGLECLEVLNMRDCSSLSKIPDLSNARKLKEFILTNCEISLQPNDLGGLESVEHLNLTSCKSIVRLPNLPNPRKLRKLNLNSCEKLSKIEGFNDFVSLEELDLSYCTLLESDLDFSRLKSLKSLKASGLHWIQFNGLEELSDSLERLTIWSCRLLEKLPDFSNFYNLMKLEAAYCDKIAYKIKGLPELKNRNCKITVDPRWK